MMNNRILLLSIISFVSLSAMQEEQANKVLAHLSQEKYFPYQDILINGQTLWNGLGTNCPYRYESLKKELSYLYNRPFTVLDIGASNGYFSLKLAQDFHAQATMVDMSDRLKHICEYNTDLHDKLIYVKKQLNHLDLKQLSKKVHYDVVLAFHVLHHIQDWKPFLNEMCNIADTVIVETPPANDLRLEKKNMIPEIVESLHKLHGTVICETPRTIPGYYDHLKIMKYGAVYPVPVDNSKKSKMFLLNQKKRNKDFKLIEPEQLSQFNLVFSKK